jgi:hypothetical protein
MGITLLPLHLGHPDRVTAAFAVKSLPTTLLFDAGGREFARFTGGAAVPADRLRAAILDLRSLVRNAAREWRCARRPWPAAQGTALHRMVAWRRPGVSTGAMCHVKPSPGQMA